MEKLLAKVLLWLAAEVVLNLVGLDDLADYSEFVFEVEQKNQMVVVATDLSPSLELH